MADNPMPIPALFWLELGTKGGMELLLKRKGVMTMEQTLRAWQLGGSRGPKPTRPEKVMFRREDVERLFPPDTKH